jgi:hypothetical protein
MFAPGSPAKRLVKATRNLFSDPLPRHHVLQIVGQQVTGSTVCFSYRAKGRDYKIALTLPPSLAGPLQSFAGAAMEQLLAAIGIAFSAFFFRLSDFAELSVETVPLDEESRIFFSNFLVGGLAEFRYLQGLDPGRHIGVSALPGDAMEPLRFDTEDRVIMLNGGGKDTIVAAELLKAAGQPFSWLTIRPNAVRRRVIELSGNPQSLEVGYEIDGRIDAHIAYPWGHVPHTSIVLSIGLLVAVLLKARYVVAGNELSADHGNVRHRNVEVNHQYTKSSAYEAGLWSFAKRRVTTSVGVFSILRPFHDLQLARLFAMQKRYLTSFISCNVGIRHGRWCRECPKCAFTALALRPFLNDEEMARIFDEDLFERVAIRKHVLALVGGQTKPWECVGTRDECLLALALVLRQHPRMDFDAYPRRADLEHAIEGADLARLRQEILDTTSAQHLIPASLLSKLEVGLRKLNGQSLTLHGAH